MSISTTFTSIPNLNDYINRIVLILENSALLLPQSVGGNTQATDLVNQIIPYKLPIPQSPITGPGAPIIFIDVSPNPTVRFSQVGRSTIDIQGPELVVLEFYCVVVAKGKTFQDSQSQMYNILAAVKTILKSNMRLGDPTTNPPNQSPLCNTLTAITVPFILDTAEKTVIARNIVIRVEKFINLRS